MYVHAASTKSGDPQDHFFFIAKNSLTEAKSLDSNIIEIGCEGFPEGKYKPARVCIFPREILSSYFYVYTRGVYTLGPDFFVP